MIAVCMALCFAELGSIYPTAGGQYPIATRVLGKEVGFVVMLNYAGPLRLAPSVQRGQACGGEA